MPFERASHRTPIGTAGRRAHMYAAPIITHPSAPRSPSCPGSAFAHNPRDMVTGGRAAVVGFVALAVGIVIDMYYRSR